VECAKDLSGELLIVKEPRGPDASRIRFGLGGVELQIDFLRSLYGVSASDLVSSKLGIVDERTSGKILYIMHHVLALASRLFNTFELPGRLTEENLSRVRLSVEAVRAYLTDQLSTQAAARQDVLPSIERIFEPRGSSNRLYGMARLRDRFTSRHPGSVGPRWMSAELSAKAVSSDARHGRMEAELRF